MTSHLQRNKINDSSAFSTQKRYSMIGKGSENVRDIIFK